MNDEGSRREQVLAAVNRLPERERAVMLLYYYEGLEAGEIGTRFGLSEDQVHQLIGTAVSLVRDLLPPSDGRSLSGEDGAP